MHDPQSSGVPRDEKYATGITVKAVNQLKGLPGPQGTQPLDDTEAHPTAAMNCNPGWLVHHQQVVIFVHDGGAHRLEQLRRRLTYLTGRTDLHRRDPDLVVGL